MKFLGRLVGTVAVVALAAGCTSTGPQAGQPMRASTDSSATTSTMQTLPSEASASSPPASPTSAPTADADATQPVPLDPTIIILDASGSMKTEDAPGPRIDAAKNAVVALVNALPDNSPVGLIVYGTGTDSSDAAKPLGCQDIKTAIPLGPVDKAAFGAAVAAVVASGYTPIGSALRSAITQLPPTGRRNIVVVSDGEDTCAPPEPCAVAQEISGPGLTLHSVGFRVSGTAKDQLACIATVGGGQYIDASNAQQLQAFLRTTIDPNAAVNALTHQGFGGVRIGMTIAEAQAVDPEITAAGSGTEIVVWRDCDLTFVDGQMVAIRPHSAVPTQDGLAVGDDISKAGQLYGPSVVEVDNGRTHAIFAVAPDSSIGYDVTFTPDAEAGAGQLLGRVTAIILCRCSPSSSTVVPVDADAYLKVAGRWWFRTPDDGWNCSVGDRVFCESRWFSGNRDVTYPPPTGPDYVPPVVGEIPLMGGMVVGTSATAAYGLYGHGDASEFVYDIDKGVPGLGRILTDGQVLTAGAYRCSVAGFAATCADPATGVGFTVSQDSYRIYPRDGAAPAPGESVAGPNNTPGGRDVIGPDRYEQLILGMTVGQAQQADPSLVITSGPTASCTEGSTTDAERVVFNPGGTLAYIDPRGNPHTPEGLQVGDTADKAIDLYAPGSPQTISPNYGANQYPVAPGSEVRYLIEFQTESTSGELAAGDVTIAGIVLNGGQRCFG